MNFLVDEPQLTKVEIAKLDADELNAHLHRRVATVGCADNYEYNVARRLSVMTDRPITDFVR